MTNIDFIEDKAPRLKPKEMVEQAVAEAMKVPGYLLENRESAINSALEHCRVIDELFSCFGPVSAIFTSLLKKRINNMIHEMVYPIKAGFKLKIKGNKILKIIKKTQFKKREKQPIF